MKLRRNALAERGSVMIIATVGMVLAMISTGLAVDLGTLAQEARRNQKVADLAALDAVRALDDLPLPDPTAAALASATRNDFECPDTDVTDDCGLTVKWSDSATGVFQNLVPPTPLTTAVQVTVTSRHNNDFPFVGSGNTVSRKGISSLGNGTGCFFPDLCEETPGVTETGVSPLATVRVGSTAASFSTQESKILDLLLNRTVGGNYSSVNAVGWQGLAAGSVKFSALRQHLGGTYATGSPSTVLDANFTYRQILDATVLAFAGDGTATASATSALATIQSQVSAVAGATMTLRDLFNIVGNVGSGNDVADARINVKDIVTGGMVLADGDHLASMDLAAADIPGLPGTGVTVKFGLIEAPQQKTGPQKTAAGVYRTTAETAQLRLLIESNLVVPLPLGLGSINLKVPYYLKGAGATASIDTIDCASGAEVPASIKVWGTTEIARTYLGTVSNADLQTPSSVAVAVSAPIGSLSVSLAGLTTVNVTVTSTANVIASVPAKSGMLTFTSPDYDGETAKKLTGTTPLTLGSAVDGNLTVGLTVSGLPVAGLTAVGLTGIINAAVNLTLDPLNDYLVKPLQRALGVSLGEADFWAPPVQTCAPTSFNTDPTSSVGGANPYGHQIPSLVG